MTTLASHQGPRDQTLATPWRWVRAVERALGRTFDLDVCAAPETAKAPRFYTELDDGLRSPWEGLCWCNPPFDNIRAWVARGIQQWDFYMENATDFGGVVFVVPCTKTEQAWWQTLRHLERKGAAWSAFPPERINYEGASSGAPFPSCFWALGPAWMRSIQQLEGGFTADLFGAAE